MMRDTNSAKTHSWSGRAVDLQTQWQLADVPNERRITGIVGFDGRFPVETLKGGDGWSDLWTVSLVIQPIEAETDMKNDESDEGVVFGIRSGAVLSVNHYEPRFVTGELMISLPVQQFDSLWPQISTEKTALALSGNIPGYDYSFPLADHPYLRLGDEQSASIQVLDLAIHVIQRTTVPLQWMEERLAKSVADSLAIEHFGNSYNTQIEIIIKEFARSVAENEIDSTLRGSLIARIHVLLREARVAFRKILNVAGNEYLDGWGLSPYEFEKAISDRDEKRISELKGQYATLWKHFSINDVVAHGEAKYGATADGLEPRVDQLEDVAFNLLMDRRMHSRTFEWALINALIYAQCIEFAKSWEVGQGLLGINLFGDFKGVATWRFILKKFIQSIWSLTYEVLKIGLTYFIAKILASENEQTAWIITTGVTITRWFYSAVGWGGKKPEVRQLELFSKMVVAHEMVRTIHFNARALRDYLYRLASDGVVFSPWVYNLLDARIRRES